MINKIAVTPYNTRESLGWVMRYITGFSRANSGLADQVKSPHVFNEQVKCQYKVAVIGDIAPMRKNRLAIDRELQEFISDSDYLIGDFEGIITKKKAALWPIAFDQRHDPDIIGDLAAMFEPGKTYFSVSNNHMGDFKEEEFSRSVSTLKSAGFNVFGWREKPYADINNDLRVVAGTMWSNRVFSDRVPVDAAKGHIKTGAYNMLYAHMGYELELYPRPEIAAFARDMADSFDGVIAGHPHCPQPVTTYHSGGLNRIIAYSLGDFCFRLKIKKMQYGLTVKMEIGKDAAGRWAVGKAQWLYTKCALSSAGHFTVKPLSGKDNLFIAN